MLSLVPILNGDITHHSLTEEERAQLVAWNRHDVIAASDAHHDGKVPGERPEIDNGNTGDTDHFTADDGADGVVAPDRPQQTPAQIAKLQAMMRGESDISINAEAAAAAADALSAGVPPAEPEESELLDDEEAEDEYDSYTRAQLQSELDHRELPRSGKRAELIARLRMDDAAG